MNHQVKSILLLSLSLTLLACRDSDDDRSQIAQSPLQTALTRHTTSPTPTNDTSVTPSLNGLCYKISINHQYLTNDRGGVRLHPESDQAVVWAALPIDQQTYVFYDRQGLYLSATDISNDLNLSSELLPQTLFSVSADATTSRFSIQSLHRRQWVVAAPPLLTLQNTQPSAAFMLVPADCGTILGSHFNLQMSQITSSVTTSFAAQNARSQSSLSPAKQLASAIDNINTALTTAAQLFHQENLLNQSPWYLLKAFREKFLTPTSVTQTYTVSPTRPIHTQKPIPWEYGSHADQNWLSPQTQAVLNSTKTQAYLIVKDGKIVLEQYANGGRADRLQCSFSMAKTVTAMLIGMAIEEGKIKGLDQKVSDFYPQYKSSRYGQHLTIGDLVRMTSGIAWDENEMGSDSNPFSYLAKSHYVNFAEQYMLSLPVIRMPGTRFHYQTGDTQLLGAILTKATGMTVSAYLQQKLWQPLGMEYDASFLLDRPNGLEKTGGGLNATLRDFAKLGQFVLQNGQWQGRQLLSADYIKLMRTTYFAPEGSTHYGYSLWTDDQHTPPFYSFVGIHGQVITIVPSANLIYVRLGENNLGQTDSSSVNKKQAFPNMSDIYWVLQEALARYQSPWYNFY